jgi:hypothetical protein
MSRPLFLPRLRQAAWLAALSVIALSYGLYLRYWVIEQSSVGIACEGGLATFICHTRRSATALFTPQVFGLLALGAALLNLIRPAFALWAIALIASGIGIVLYNAALSALALALLVLSLARPAPERD